MSFTCVACLAVGILLNDADAAPGAPAPFVVEVPKADDVFLYSPRSDAPLRSERIDKKRTWTGVPSYLFVYYLTDPDCLSRRILTTIVEGPTHGKLVPKTGMSPLQGARQLCGGRPADGFSLVYVPEPGWAGKDTVVVDIADGGHLTRIRDEIEVMPHTR